MTLTRRMALTVRGMPVPAARQASAQLIYNYKYFELAPPIKYALQC
jgi:hypothetical protein